MGSVVGMYAQIWPLVLTIAMVAGYFLKQFFWPAPATRKHEQLRLDWLQSLTTTAQTEVLGVQTIRNSLMSCTMTATTATLAFMGGVTLLHGDVLAQVERQHILYWHALAVLLLLGLAFITSMLAARQWHHAGFVVGMPVASPQRQQWLGGGPDQFAPGRALLRGFGAVDDVVCAHAAGGPVSGRGVGQRRAVVGAAVAGD